MPPAVSSWLAAPSLGAGPAGLLRGEPPRDHSSADSQGQGARECGPAGKRWKDAHLRPRAKERRSSSSSRNSVPCWFCQLRRSPSQAVRQPLLQRRKGASPQLPELRKSMEDPAKGTCSSDLTRGLAFLLAPGLLLLYGEAAWATGGGAAEASWAAVLGEALYALGQNANTLVQGQLQGGLTLTSGAVILGAGLVTSLSPCTLSVLPLTIGYIGGYDQGRSRAALVRDAAAFSLGLATTLAALGTGASLAGRAYGQIGAGLPIAASVVAMLMGLNLLEVLPLRFPSFLGNVDARELASGLPSSAQAYLAGLVFALAASPCSTPVLATLLTYVAAKQDPLVGSALLFTYTAGYVTPLLVAASFTGALKQLLALRKFSAWINPASGCLLLSGGLYTFLLRVVPAQ